MAHWDRQHKILLRNRNPPAFQLFPQRNPTLLVLPPVDDCPILAGGQLFMPVGCAARIRQRWAPYEIRKSTGPGPMGKALLQKGLHIFLQRSSACMTKSLALNKHRQLRSTWHICRHHGCGNSCTTDNRRHPRTTEDAAIHPSRKSQEETGRACVIEENWHRSGSHPHHTQP